LNALFIKTKWRPETIQTGRILKSLMSRKKKMNNSMKKMKTIMAVLILSFIGLNSINAQSNIKNAFKVTPLTIIKGQ
jgi:recombinational DNA repair protein (RecF pathway)